MMQQVVFCGITCTDKRGSVSGSDIVSQQSGDKLGKTSTAIEVVNHYGVDLSGKTAVVTGGNSGIGLETCKALASRGCRIVMMSYPDEEAGCEAVREEIIVDGLGGYAVREPNVEVVAMDLGDLGSVSSAATKVLEVVRDIDFLVLNAGVAGVGRAETKQGFEMHIGVNHFGHFHFTDCLLPALRQQASPCRVVVVSSVAHASFGDIQLDDLHYTKGRPFPGQWGAYGQSKLANILFARELYRREQLDSSSKLSVLAVHPGVTWSKLWEDAPTRSVWTDLMARFVQDKASIPQAASSVLYACLAPAAPSPSEEGMYIVDCAVGKESEQARDMELAEQLWLETQKQIRQALQPGANAGPN